MPTVRLNEREVARLRPDAAGKAVLYWDADLKGFGLLVSGKTGKRVFVVQRAVNGKNRRVTVAACNELSFREAKEAARAMLVDMRRGVDPKNRVGRATLAEALETYLKKNTALRNRTAATYSAVIQQHLADWLDVPLASISGSAVSDRHLAIGKTSPSVANLAFKIFAAIWNDAVLRDPVLPPNPTRLLRKQWFRIARRQRSVRMEDLPRFLEGVRQLPNPVVASYIRFLLYTGMRRREAACLTWHDIDFTSGVVRVRAENTKADRKLDLPMSDLVRGLLVERRSVGRERYVFPSGSRSRHIEEPRKSFAIIAASTGIAVSPHDLRRTFVTVAESCDISPMALKALVNHTLGSGLTEGYVIMSTERLREAAQRVADKMKALCGIAVPDGVVKMRS